MKKISCIIVDDEPLALDLLESYIKKTPFLELQQRCKNAFEVLDFLQANSVDLIFLDIQMPDLTGVELSKIIQNKSRIIFTTAFEQYAIEGYKVNAIGYLLKPFDYDEFLQATLKAQQLILSENETQAATKNEQNFIFVKSEYKLIKIEFDAIEYIESMKDYLKIHINSQPKPILTLMSLTKIEEVLPENFLRIHRSYIINLNAIESIERMRVYIKNEPLPVSESYKDVFNEKIGRYLAE
jgi:DNA-binding LytR/AlgR family response regulator